MLNKPKEDNEVKSKNQEVILETHTEIDGKYSGYVDKLEDGFAEVHLDIIRDMYADEQGLIHNGFIFSGASFAAAAAVNHKYGFVIGAVINFLTPVRDEDKVVYQAVARQKVGRKRVVDVIGQVGDIKVFIGEFTVLIMEKHILNIKLDEINLPEYNRSDSSDD